MTAKRKVQLFITISAVVIGLLHLFFPSLKIDAILITLIIIAIIPWLEPLLKSVELPGGLKVEFQDFKNLETGAIKAGLIKEETTIESGAIVNPNPDTFSFVEIAEKNQELALVSFRIEIEKRLRNLADKYSIESNRFSIVRLIEAFGKKEILTHDETSSLKDMIHTLNQAAHGIEYDQRNANWVIENGPKILNSLDEKLEIRGGRFSFGSLEEKEHWIDKSFRNCNWVTTYEWGECIKKHSALWEKEMTRIYDSLLKKLEEPQVTKLIESQTNWLKQIELEKDFLYSFKDIKLRVGTGGLSIAATSFMNKIRERTLELEEILNTMTD